MRESFFFFFFNCGRVQTQLDNLFAFVLFFFGVSCDIIIDMFIWKFLQFLPLYLPYFFPYSLTSLSPAPCERDIASHLLTKCKQRSTFNTELDCLFVNRHVYGQDSC